MVAMSPHEFVAKWRLGTPSHGLSERAGAQPHFIDLCRALGVPEPGEPERYCFERGVTKTGSAAARTDGFADVWLKGHFAWEYKRPGRPPPGGPARRLAQPAGVDRARPRGRAAGPGHQPYPERIVARPGFEA
jgi:hypothetical protein